MKRIAQLCGALAVIVFVTAFSSQPARSGIYYATAGVPTATTGVLPASGKLMDCPSRCIGCGLLFGVTKDDGYPRNDYGDPNFDCFWATDHQCMLCEGFVLTTDPKSGGRYDAEIQKTITLAESGDGEGIAKLLETSPRFHLNAQRQSVQVDGCGDGGGIAANIPLPKNLFAAVSKATKVRAADLAE
jgi:hypothetical protein